jgi:hypothetical protein
VRQETSSPATASNQSSRLRSVLLAIIVPFVLLIPAMIILKLVNVAIVRLNQASGGVLGEMTIVGALWEVMGPVSYVLCACAGFVFLRRAVSKYRLLTGFLYFLIVVPMVGLWALFLAFYLFRESV